MKNRLQKDDIRHENQKKQDLDVCGLDPNTGTNTGTSASLMLMIPLLALGTATLPLLLNPLFPQTFSPSQYGAADSFQNVEQRMETAWVPARKPGAPQPPTIGLPPVAGSEDQPQQRAAAPEMNDGVPAVRTESSLSSLQDNRFERFMRRWLSMPEELRPPPLPEDFKPSAPEIRGDNVTAVYLTSSSVARDDFLIKTLDAVSEYPNPAIVVDVKGSFVYFHSDAALANELNLVRPLYELPELYRLTRERGVYLIARYIAIKDDSLSRVLPETQVRNLATGTKLGLGWVDPAHPTTLEYNRQIIEDVVPYVDEINLDYIRYSTALPPHFYGVNGDEKADRIEEFLKMTREVIDANSPSTKFGISTYAILGWNFPINLEPLGQHIPRFAPYVDIISPMAYPATFSVGAYYNPAKHPRSRMYYLVYRTLTGYNELVGEEHQHKIRPWIQGYSTTTQNMRDQMDAVYDAGHCGFQVWSAGNHYSQTYAAMGLVTRPERCL